MLPTNDYARKLDADLDAIGNGPDAVAALLAALERMPASDEPIEFGPTEEDIQAMLDLEERYEYEIRYHVNFHFI